MPEAAFLYPSFNARAADIDEALYYSANVKDLKADFVQAMFGTAAPLPAPIQKQAFAGILEEVFEGVVDYDTTCNIKDCLDEAVVSAEESADSSACMLKEDQIKRLIEEASGEYAGAAGAVGKPADTGRLPRVLKTAAKQGSITHTCRRSPEGIVALGAGRKRRQGHMPEIHPKIVKKEAGRRGRAGAQKSIYG